MVKECSVILNNDRVTVVRFNDIDIQFPSIKRDAKAVYVQRENDKYSIVDKPRKAVTKRKKIETTDLNMDEQPEKTEWSEITE